MAAEIDQVAENAHGGNHKSILQQLAQREYGATPAYLLLDEKGPDHSKCFKIAAVIGSHYFTGAWGRTENEAEQKAALYAFWQLATDTTGGQHLKPFLPQARDQPGVDQ